MGGIRFKIPTILRRIAADATLYFIAIFTSHVFLMVSLVVGWVSVQPFVSVDHGFMTRHAYL